MSATSRLNRGLRLSVSNMSTGFFAEGRSIAMYFGHCGNWEWGTSITLWSRFKPSDKIVYAQVYRPLTNEWFNRYFLMLRSRFRIGEL